MDYLEFDSNTYSQTDIMAMRDDTINVYYDSNMLMDDMSNNMYYQRKQSPFEIACESGNYYKIMELKVIGEIKPSDISYGINAACKYGHLNVIQWIYKNYNIKEHIDDMFETACLYNQLEMAKWIDSEFKIDENTRILSDNIFGECSCNAICSSGNIDILKWFKQRFDFKIKPSYIIRAGKENKLETFEWLCSQVENKDILIEGFKGIIEWHFKIMHVLKPEIKQSMLSILKQNRDSIDIKEFVEQIKQIKN